MVLNYMKTKAAIFSYTDIKKGMEFSFEIQISKQNVQSFAQLVGDHNPLHIDTSYGKKSSFGKNIVHGMLMGSFFSALIGMYCPGERSVYLSQMLHFKKPIFCGDRVTVKGTVKEKTDSIQVITLKTEILKEGVVMIDGEAKVKVM